MAKLLTQTEIVLLLQTESFRILMFVYLFIVRPLILVTPMCENSLIYTVEYCRVSLGIVILSIVLGKLSIIPE